MKSTPVSAAPVDLHRLLEGELSLRSRLAYVALMLASSAMTVVILSLWVTEPALPLRTTVAFAAMTAIGGSWIVFAGWVLARRRVLLGRDRVVAARMAIAFTSAFALGALLAFYTTGGPAAFAALLMGLVLLAAAIAMLLRARRRVARLTERRDAIERDLRASA